MHKLRCATRPLEPDGTLVVTAPAFPALWTNHDDPNHHMQRFTSARSAPSTGHPQNMRYFY